jgi:hypothetical protein
VGSIKKNSNNGRSIKNNRGFKKDSLSLRNNKRMEKRNTQIMIPKKKIKINKISAKKLNSMRNRL